MTAGHLAEWKAALAAHHKRQRQQRGRRNLKASEVRPGMVRIPATTLDGEPDKTG